MNRRAVLQLLLFMLSLSTVTMEAAAQTPPRFTFSLIAKTTSGGFYDFGGVTSVNHDGLVAFTGGFGASGYGLYTGDGTILNAYSGTGFSYLDGYVSLNNAGTIVFPARLTSGARGIFASSAGAMTPVAETGPRFIGFGKWPDVNNAGEVAFSGTEQNSANGIYRASSGGISTLADTSGTFQSFWDPSINGLGQVAFWGQSKDSTTGIYTSQTAGTVTTIANNAPDSTFSGLEFYSFGRVVAINDAGSVAFTATLKNDFTSGVFVATGGTIKRISDNGTASPFSHFGENICIDPTGVVVFKAWLKAGGHGLYTGADPADKVAATGDAVAGGVLSYLDFPSINDRGQVAFYANYTDWSAGIVRADRYVAPPTLSNIKVTKITKTSATITWTTDLPATSVVAYGLNDTYGNTETRGDNVTGHEITLTALLPTTRYHFQVQSSTSGGTATSADATFETLSPEGELIISNVAVTEITKTSAVVTWSTNLPSDSLVRYGKFSKGYQDELTETALVTEHRVKLEELQINTQYNFTVSSATSDGLSASSQDGIFQTAFPQPVITGTDPDTYVRGEPNFTFTLEGRYFTPDTVVGWSVGASFQTCEVQYISSSRLKVTAPINGGATDNDFAMIRVSTLSGKSAPYKIKAAEAILVVVNARAYREVYWDSYGEKERVDVSFCLKNVSSKTITGAYISWSTTLGSGYLFMMFGGQEITLAPGQTSEPIYMYFGGVVRHTSSAILVKGGWDGGRFYETVRLP